MVYYNNIPAGASRPTASAGQFRSNFTDLDAVFNENHIGFSQTEDRGEHRKVTFNNVIADPAEGDPKASLYTKTIAGDSELFFENYDNATAVNIVRQLTNLNITNLGNPGTAAGTLYRIDLPINVTIYCGVTNAFSGGRTMIFPAAYTIIYASLATANDVNPQNIASQNGLANLTLRTANSVQVSWFAIGRI